MRDHFLYQTMGRCTQDVLFPCASAAVECLLDAGMDLASLANNHSLDFGVDGLWNTLDLVRRHGIQTAGAGENSAEAAQPGIIRCGELSLGMAAFCDH